jgi:hypothetical protein
MGLIAVCFVNQETSITFSLKIEEKETLMNDNQFVVTDIKMPFWSMVVFMVKWALASIPAFIILSVIGAFLWAGIKGLIAYYWA